MYNVIYPTDDYREGDMFDRFGRNCLYQKDVFNYNLVSIDDIEDNNQKNIILGSHMRRLIKHGKKIRKLLSKKNFVLVFPVEHEAVHDMQLNWIYKNISANNFQQDKIYIVSYDVNSKNTFKEWKREYNIKSDMNSIYIDTFLFQNLDVFFENQEIVHTEHFEKKGVRPYYYVCYNADPKQHRVRFVEDLQKEKLDKLGLISLLRDENPLILDRKKIDHEDMTTQRYPIDHYRDTYFSIVTESYFWAHHGEHYKHITGINEKTYKAMLLNPFIVLGGCGTLKHLKKLGFKTFPELFDESYDEIFDPYLRYDKVLESVRKVCNMDKEEINDLYHSVLIDKVKYNQNLYMDYDRKEMFDIFLNQIKWK